MLTLLAIALLSTFASAQMNNGVMSPPANTRPPRLENVGIEQHLDAQVPPDLTFRDDTGKTVKLGDYFGQKPLILNLVYYNCTMLCGEALAGLASAMRLIKFDVGNEFDVITVSFDPRETPEMAAAKKKDYVGRYGRPNAASARISSPDSRTQSTRSPEPSASSISTTPRAINTRTPPPSWC